MYYIRLLLCTYWLSACSLIASLRASRHWSLASLMAPQLLLTATIFMEQFNSSESSCHFSTRLSPAHKSKQRGKESTWQTALKQTINVKLTGFSMHCQSKCVDRHTLVDEADV